MGPGSPGARSVAGCDRPQLLTLSQAGHLDLAEVQAWRHRHREGALGDRIPSVSDTDTHWALGRVYRRAGSWVMALVPLAWGFPIWAWGGASETMASLCHCTPWTSMPSLSQVGNESGQEAPRSCPPSPPREGGPRAQQVYGQARPQGVKVATCCTGVYT